MQKFVNQRGFTVVNVGNDGNISNLIYFHNGLFQLCFLISGRKDKVNLMISLNEIQMLYFFTV